MNMNRKLARSKTDKMLGGVCGGIAEYFDWPSWVVRFVYVLVSILSAAFPGILIYLLLWLLMPLKQDD
ncbi:MAG: stress-responsive transcriptional regulator [Deltaproteobacteria bacterium HGW-Deltaproteobacteria-4]|nr:MAG: stress-responsive transcriptional regulator [Deltaproteobacteria bacterium HGW-Deltaproteobacteria-4]